MPLRDPVPPTPSNPEEIDETELLEVLSDFTDHNEYYIEVIKLLSNTRRAVVNGFELPVSTATESKLPVATNIEDGAVRADIEAALHKRNRVQIGRVALQSLDAWPHEYRYAGPSQYHFRLPSLGEEGLISARTVRGFFAGIKTGSKALEWSDIENMKQGAESSQTEYAYDEVLDDGSHISIKLSEMMSARNTTNIVTMSVTRPESYGDLTTGTAFSIVESETKKSAMGLDSIEPDVDVSVVIGSRSSVETNRYLTVESLDDEFATPVSAKNITRTQLADIIELLGYLKDKEVSTDSIKPE